MRKSFAKQFNECKQEGFLESTEFASFEKHPELIPVFPVFNKDISLAERDKAKKEMFEDIKTGKITGIDLFVCGRFGGWCQSGNEGCQKLRKENV